MPEIKHQFTGGKMNKDLDERLVPNGEYRDAMNVQVATSEGSDVGTIQNILGNEMVLPFEFTDGVVVGAISDEKVDTMYYLVWTPSVDYIFSWNGVEHKAVFVDTNQSNVLKFDPNNIITGINVIDGLLFWTDNINEPRKINIQRCIDGTLDINNQTKLLNNSTGDFSTIEEKHITVIRKAPQVSPRMLLKTTRDFEKIYSVVMEISPTDDGSSSFVPNAGLGTIDGTFNFSNLSSKDGKNKFAIKLENGLNGSGSEAPLVTPPNGAIAQGITGVVEIGTSIAPQLNGKKVVLQAYDNSGNPPGLPLTDYVIKGEVYDVSPQSNGGYDRLYIKITTIDGFPDVAEDTNLKYVVDFYNEEEKLFEFKYPRFSYRYKFEDGEYSPFAPFTQVAFSPGSFDYHPRKGYNIGMTNRIVEVKLLDIVTSQTPKDVVSIDILFKDDASPSIYVVDTIKPNDYNLPNSLNEWYSLLESSLNPDSEYGFSITKESINSIVPSNQLLRPWDNVPKKALGEDITGNRIVYANYTQNYNLTTGNGKKYVPSFLPTRETFDDDNSLLFNQSTSLATNTFKSIKSLREYQLGVVFIDSYGRETPVISNTSGTIKYEKQDGDTSNRIGVQFNSDDYPEALSHFKFFIKETSNEYYNMAMDRWYSAGDGNIWLAFPSSDRNKIDIDTFLILKKGSDKDELVKDAARYKVLAIENEAPDFIKTTKRKAVSVTHTAGGGSDLFGSFDNQAPFEGDDNFQMNFAPFSSTAGRDLDSSQEEQWIEFGKVGTDQVSARYKIVSITNDLQDDNTNIGTSKYSVKLEERLGADVNFITDDPLGQTQSKVENGAIVNVYRYKVENLDRFDGRFFVKIYFDEVFRRNIETTLIGGGVRVSEEKKIYSMNNDMIAKHTANVGNFLTKTKSYGSKYGLGIRDWCYGDEATDGIHDQYETAGINSNSMGLSPYDFHYGYYLINEFTANALYFRKYRVKKYDVTDDVGVDQDSLSQVNTQNTQATINGLNANNHQLLIHLQNGDKNDTNVVDSSNSVEYQGRHYKDTTDWWREFGYKTHERHLTRISGPHGAGKGITASWNIDRHNDWWQYLKQTDDASYKSDRDSVRDNEVWFIDAGPIDGRKWSTNNILNFENNTKPRPYTPGDFTSVGDFNGGANVGGSSWNMNLGFGGLKGSKAGAGDQPAQGQPNDGNAAMVEGFWEIGNWNNSAGGQANSGYNDGPTASFVSKLNTGQQFRWKEDSDGTVYTISNTVTTDEFLRHSWGNAQKNEEHIFTAGGPASYQPGFSRNLMDNASQNFDFNLVDDRAYDLDAMAENLSFNFTKNWNINGITPSIQNKWDPTKLGVISGGLTMSIKSVDVLGTDGSTTSNATISGDASDVSIDLIIYIKSKTITTTQAATTVPLVKTLHVGMALTSYTAADGSTMNVLSEYDQDGLVIRYIAPLQDTNGNDYYALYLGGYTSGLTDSNHDKLVSTKPPAVNTDYVFKQMGMNGYSPNSEFNINTIAHAEGFGKIGAVGYTLEFVEEIQPTEILSENPAIWETEPKESTELDIYYEACGAIPASINENTVQDAFPVGTRGINVTTTNSSFTVVGHQGDGVIVQTLTPTVNAPAVVGNEIKLYRQDNLIVNATVDTVSASVITGPPAIIQWLITFKQNLTDNKFILPWHNCYTFRNGVESNRIRDNFNLPFISNGVKASTTLEQEYEEENRKYGLIYSGIYNSTSGINNLNQFIAAEKITKDINPIYGSIQKLYSRDSDLVALCEDKILRIQANKDALFNADGNSNVVASSNVLGQTIPFSGEFGISTNPESFASESYRAYFTDKVRGAVIRLSKDGITPISDAGMKDWFRDNLRDATSLIGSYDDRNNEYNLRVSNFQAPVAPLAGARVAQMAAVSSGGPSQPATNYTLREYVLSFSEKVGGWVSFKSFTNMQYGISLANNYYTFDKGNLYLHYSETKNRNTFYSIFNPSTFDVVLNDNPGLVKVFNTLNYEGSQAKVDAFTSEEKIIDFQPNTTYNDQEYYNLYEKQGWSVQSIVTNKETGYIKEFIEKDGEWFNGINKNVDISAIQDAGDFTFQGIGQITNLKTKPKVIGVVAGCTNPLAINYDPAATADDGSCFFKLDGCTDPDAENYNPKATGDDGSCIYKVLPEPSVVQEPDVDVEKELKDRLDEKQEIEKEQEKIKEQEQDVEAVQNQDTKEEEEEEEENIKRY